MVEGRIHNFDFTNHGYLRSQKRERDKARKVGPRYNDRRGAARERLFRKGMVSHASPEQFSTSQACQYWLRAYLPSIVTCTMMAAKVPAREAAQGKFGTWSLAGKPRRRERR